MLAFSEKMKMIKYNSAVIEGCVAGVRDGAGDSSLLVSHELGATLAVVEVV